MRKPMKDPNNAAVPKSHKFVVSAICQVTMINNENQDFEFLLVRYINLTKYCAQLNKNQLLMNRV